MSGKVSRMSGKVSRMSGKLSKMSGIVSKMSGKVSRTPGKVSRTSSTKLLQWNFFTKTSSGKLLQRSFFSETSSAKHLQQNFFSETSSAICKGEYTNMGAEKFPLTSMGGWAEGLACADPLARTPLGNSGIINTKQSLILPHLAQVDFQLSWKSGKSQLARWATKWYCSAWSKPNTEIGLHNPLTHPPPPKTFWPVPGNQGGWNST